MQLWGKDGDVVRQKDRERERERERACGESEREREQGNRNWLNRMRDELTHLTG